MWTDVLIYMHALGPEYSVTLETRDLGMANKILEQIL